MSLVNKRRKISRMRMSQTIIYKKIHHMVIASSDEWKNCGLESQNLKNLKMEINQTDRESIKEKIRKQIEFYLSDSNVRKDKFIRELMKDEDGKLADRKYVQLEQFIKFNRIKQLTNEIDDLRAALKESEFLEINEDETSVRRRFSIDFKKDIDNCTIYVENLPDFTDHDWLNELFSHFGSVTHVSLPRFQENKKHKGFAFIEYSEEKEASIACEFFALLNRRKDKLKLDGESRTVVDELLNNLTMDELDEMNYSFKNKKRSNEESNDDNLKRIKRDSWYQVENDQYCNFREVMQKFKVKYEENVDQLLKLRVISKLEWSNYKKKYLNLKRKFQNRTNNFNDESEDEETTNTQTDSVSKSRKEKTENKYNMEPGLILKLEYIKTSLPDEESLIKRKLREIDGDKAIAYIDVKLNLNQCYIRFKDKKFASVYSKQDKLNEFGKVTILEGLEEEKYWLDIMQSLLDKKKKKSKRSEEDIRNNNKDDRFNENDSKKDSDEQDTHYQSAKKSFKNFKKGLIIRLQMDINLNDDPSEQELKKKIRSSTNGSYIAYIDQNYLIHNIFLSSELVRKTIFIRTISNDCTKKVMESELKKLGELTVLEGEEELNYWEHVKECSQQKRPKNFGKKILLR